MEKKNLIAAFIAKCEADLVVLTAAAKATHEAATNEESKPENEYDTRALEASYLAGAQAKRVGEIQEIIEMFRRTPLKVFAPEDAVQFTAIVNIEVDGKGSTVFFMPKGGGESVQFEGKTIQIVTPGSVLGGAIKGLSSGDSTTFQVGEKIREVDIVDIE
jgi:transcription elongation GreA/GreB family factor